MNSIKVSNGYLKIKDEEAEDFLDNLMDKGILWEYLSLVFNSSIKDKDKYLSQMTGSEQDNEAMKEMLDMMKAMQSQMNSLQKTVNEKTIVSKAVSTSPNSETKEEIKAPPKRKKKKVDTSKMNLGNNAFAQMASKMKQFEK